MSSLVLVTGANGFIGGALARRLLAEGRPVRAAVRGGRAAMLAPTVDVGDIGASTNWKPALADVDVVVHCAARVHQLRDTSTNPLLAFRAVNRDGTLRLAEQAAAQGVRRFVFISSIGVNGAETFDHPFRADDVPAPHSPYAVAKHEAELALRDIAARTAMEVVVLRPPLVYGPGAPGNFAMLLRALDRGWLLPLGAIHNQRSFIALDNLVDALIAAIDHPKAGGRTLLVSDGADLSTTELLHRLGHALGRPARLVSLPAHWLRGAARLLGRAELGQRLCGSLAIDMAATRTALDWQPPLGINEALIMTARHFLATAR